MEIEDKQVQKEKNPKGKGLRDWWWQNKYKHGTGNLKRCFQCGMIIGNVPGDFCEFCEEFK